MPYVRVTVHRASTDADWREATALLYDYVEWVRGWTGIDPVAEQPQLHAELERLADHYVTDDAALYLAAWEAIGAGAVAIRVQPDGSAELKRMYVRPFARGRGVADRLIRRRRRRGNRATVSHRLARDAPWCDGPGDIGVPAPRLRRVIDAAAHAEHGRRHRHGALAQRDVRTLGPERGGAIYLTRVR